jgi:MFS family permease
MSQDREREGTASGVAAIPAAINDMAVDTVRDVKQLPQATAKAAAFPAKRLLLPLCLAQFMSSYDTQSMSVAIGDIVSDLDTTVTRVQTAISLFTLVMAAGMITGSKLADMWGRKRTFIAGVALFGFGALLTALTPSINVMYISWSLLEGLGSILMIPPIYILITVSFEDTKARAAAFGAVTAMAGIGAASGPLLGGAITTLISWRASFALGATLAVVVLLLSNRIVEAKPQGPRPKLDIIGAILSAIGMIALVLGTLLAGQYGWLTARQDFSIAGQVLIEEGGISPVLPCVAIGIIVLLAFGAYMGYRERRGKVPLVRTRVLRNRVAFFGLITQGAQWFLSLGIVFITSVFLQVTFEYSAIETGLILTPATLGILFLSRRAGKIAHKYSQRAIIQAGFVVVGAGVLILFLMVDANSAAWRFIPGLLLIGSGIGLIMPASVNLVQSAASEEDQGDISGVSRSASNLGSSLGTAVAGAVLVSVLIAGVTQFTEDSTVLPPAAKEQIATALEGDVTAISDTQVREALEGQPSTVVEEVVRINADARNRALGLALLTIGLMGMVGLVATFFLPGQRRRVPDTAIGSP